MLCMGLYTKTFSQRQMQKLNRGLIAVYKGSNTVYISWRLFALEDWTVGFNVYRATNGAIAVKRNTTLITTSTNFTDATVDITKTNVYYVKTVINGVETETSETFTLAANTPTRQYFPITLQPINDGTYTVNHVYVGDVDGDGDFDYIVKRYPDSVANNTIKLDCYNNDGIYQWRIDLGPNVETYIGTMTAPVLVADYNGDGKAELIIKTGESTVFGDGTKIGDTNADGITDYNSHSNTTTMAHIFDGPEFISLINGKTGAEMNRNNFITRGKTSDWGDAYGARVNFIMSSVCSFDGVKPGILLSRGEGSHMVVEAWDVTNSKLTRLWNWTAVGNTFNPGGWVDFHQIQCIDVNGDGKDEISFGVCMLNPNGTVRYTTGLVHGDRLLLTDINPNRAGLEAFVIQQNSPTLIGSALYDASTGTILKKWYITSTADIGRGDVADIDPNSPGMEMFDVGQVDVHASDGTEASTGSCPYPYVSIWWDGDLLRENLIGVGSGAYNPAINKWNYTTKAEARLFSIYNDGGAYSVTSPYGGRVPLAGDILGDWREEIILETANRKQLRIYTTNIETNTKVYTLMQNPGYFNAMSTKGYLCTKYTDYFLGNGMLTPSVPKITIINPQISQSISLKTGWNFISFNVSPTVKAIDTVFKAVIANVSEIKTADGFWRSGQNPIFNSLKTITDGSAYLVNMKVAGTISLTGVQITTGLPVIKTGWQMLGCTYQTSTSLSSIFSAANCSIIKNFSGYWIPLGTSNSISTLDPGKGYFLKK